MMPAAIPTLSLHRTRLAGSPNFPEPPLKPPRREGDGRRARLNASAAAKVTLPRAKRYLSDGLLVGPFPEENAFGLLIVNTDGTLAERSGNGLTIFSQFLVDTGRANRSDAFFVRVYHDKPGSPIVEARIEAAERDGQKGFWIDMGLPTYGLSAVGAALRICRSF